MPTYSQLIVMIADAQKREDEASVVALTDQAKTSLGAMAGVPEHAPTFTGPITKTLIKTTEIKNAFVGYEKEIARLKWWRIGDDPTRARFPLRNIASIVTGCVYAQRAGCINSSNLLAIARSGADYLLWAQSRAGTGLFPFPAVRNGTDRAFIVSEQLLKKAEQLGVMKDVVHNGWIVDDLGEGGLQYDNALCAVACLELFRTTMETKYLVGARRAAEWAISRPCVPNWNYNSFSAFLLAEMSFALNDSIILTSAIKKLHLGIYPGQLISGVNRGRWFDSHNSLVEYHYILVRSLVALSTALRFYNPEIRRLMDSLFIALAAYEGLFTYSKGIPDIESAMEALTMLEQRGPALEVIGSYCVAKVRAGGLPVAPGAWGRYLAFARKIS